MEYRDLLCALDPSKKGMWPECCLWIINRIREKLLWQNKNHSNLWWC